MTERYSCPDGICQYRWAQADKCEPCREHRRLLGKNQMNKDRALPHVRFIQSRCEAGRRNYEWSITLEQYTDLLEDCCFYCMNFFTQARAGVGLDRIDNSKGYTIDNVIRCCRTCNCIRMQTLTVAETMCAVQSIIAMKVNNENK